jgi:hypothetical protein
MLLPDVGPVTQEGLASGACPADGAAYVQYEAAGTSKPRGVARVPCRGSLRVVELPACLALLRAMQCAVHLELLVAQAAGYALTWVER